MNTLTPLNKTWPTTQLLGIPVDCCTKQALFDTLMDHMLSETPSSLHMVTMNAEMAYAATQSTELKDLLCSADIVIPDGIGVVWGLSKLGVPQERIPGVELVESFLRHSQDRQLKIFILGSSPKTLKDMESKLPDFNSPLIVGMQHGYYQPDEEAQILEAIKKAQPHLLLVALGVPRQEEWIKKHKDALNIPLCIGVGGSFDVLSGQLQRAPEWMRKNHLEWMYRLFQQPTRAGRMLSLPKFVIKVLYEH